ncbi:TetR/AcrR family transcriptional regulator [Amycolatopsis saalfeldensis]|uniref:DNA-binding transcriptional regulator, AcrR family n=1 Tax=Amycolatopsis saalfeldensis TaxID=394193 RepID=A0A1H8YSH1_9PSEU|nr:TetR/AcrR family transcriptional regulator [Amycolatopsis saalfeldensis]SEP54338.1 DNA-binding transcriptional regulator, AcrR family [Amycolatopsis saalfeldensis]
MVDKAGPLTRPLRADARRNRDQVLAVAREMLSVDGLSVSFDEIARRAGVGVGTVYRHFPTRNALFEAVLLGRVEEFTEQARTLAAAENPSGEAFLGYFAHLVGEVALNQALCDAFDDDAGAGIALPGQLRQEFIRSFDALLEHARTAGAVRTDVDIADVLDLLIGAAAAGRRGRLRGTSDQLIAIVVDGLRPRQSAT